VGKKRQREKAVRDGAAIRRVARPLAIDVDPLEIVDRLGERVDALLGDLDPRRDRDLFADAGFQLADAGQSL